MPIEKVLSACYNIITEKETETLKPRKGKEMYEVIIHTTAKFSNNEYAFNSKKECMAFLDEVLSAGCYENIVSITKYNKHSFRSAWGDFFF